MCNQNLDKKEQTKNIYLCNCTCVYVCIDKGKHNNLWGWIKTRIENSCVHVHMSSFPLNVTTEAQRRITSRGSIEACWKKNVIDSVCSLMLTND